MIVYRIVRDTFREDLSGRGSFLYGGRWNSEGVYALYTSQHRSLALLETLVHIPISSLRENIYYLLEIEILNEYDLKELPLTGDSQEMGDTILTAKGTIGFRAPSVLFKEEHNVILNPLYESYNDLVKIKKSTRLDIDKRFAY